MQVLSKQFKAELGNLIKIVHIYIWFLQTMVHLQGYAGQHI
jgi:hypothetical protein